MHPVQAVLKLWAVRGCSVQCTITPLHSILVGRCNLTFGELSMVQAFQTLLGVTLHKAPTLLIAGYVISETPLSRSLLVI